VSPVHHIQGCDRNQTLLLPNSVDDYIGPDNPIRFVDAFVGQLDMQGAGFFRVEPNETGRPGYHPADLLKLYIYGYLNRVRSSRRLETETRRNLEVMWLLRGLTPKHAFFESLFVFCRTDGKTSPLFLELSLAVNQHKIILLLQTADRLSFSHGLDWFSNNMPLSSLRGKKMLRNFVAFPF
jgi:transposase